MTTQPNEETSAGTDNGAGGSQGSVNEAPLAVAPAAMGSGSATPIAAPAALVDHGVTGDIADGRVDPDQEAFNSGEDEVGGSDGPVGGTVRP